MRDGEADLGVAGIDRVGAGLDLGGVAGRRGLGEGRRGEREGEGHVWATRDGERRITGLLRGWGRAQGRRFGEAQIGRFPRVR